jgi:hypothetical protein
MASAKKRISWEIKQVFLENKKSTQNLTEPTYITLIPSPTLFP